MSHATSSDASARRLRQRYRAERRFRAYGLAAIGAALPALALLLGSIVASSLPAFVEHRVRLTLHPDRTLLDAADRSAAGLAQANYGAVLTQTDDVEDSSPVYIPNGSGLTFARKFLDVQRWTPGRQIWMMNVDGSQAAALTDEPYHNHYDLAWSPDGSDLAYVRFNKDDLTEPPELWMMGANGSNATRLVTSGYLPQWIP